MKNDVKAKTVSDSTQKAAVAKKAAPMKEKAAEGVAAAVKNAEKTAAKVAEKTEKVVEKAVEKTEEAATKTVKAVAKKAPAKKTAVKETVYLQYLGKEINKDELVKQVKGIWTKERKNKVADLKEITLYLKPEENAAYYVVNGDVTGKIEL